MTAIQFLDEPIIKETKEVMVPVYDDYFQKEENIPGVTHVFLDPVPMPHKINFSFATAYHDSKFQSIEIFPLNSEKIDRLTVLKIANIFEVDQVKIKEFKNGTKYSLSYGPKNYEWEYTEEIHRTIKSDLEFEPVLCYGITEYDVNRLIHTRPIASA